MIGERKDSLPSTAAEKIFDSEDQAKREVSGIACSCCGTPKAMRPDDVEMYYSVARFCKEQLDLCKDHYCILLSHAFSKLSFQVGDFLQHHE